MNNTQVRKTLTKSRAGFQRLVRGPRKNFMTGMFRQRALHGFASGINMKRFTSTPFKIIGLRF